MKKNIPDKDFKKEIGEFLGEKYKCALNSFSAI